MTLFMKPHGMRRLKRQSNAGIALVMVMMFIITLAILAGGFAYSMRIETRLARNTFMEPDLEWLGRSGVELAKFVIAQESDLPGQPYTALNQAWAGGIGITNEVFATITLQDMPVGDGFVSVEIIDRERKVNINIVGREILEQALMLMQVDAGEFSTIIDSILDWRDPDEDTLFSGAETDAYLPLGYIAKNGPLGDISELLLIRGITREMFYGQSGMSRLRLHRDSEFGAFGYPYGLEELFTTISMGRLNINTASAVVLQVLPGVDEALAQAIVQTRAGLDAYPGNEDDTPFQSPGELANVPGMFPELISAITPLTHVRSFVFEIHVTARVGKYIRRYKALIYRGNPRNIQTLMFSWE